MPAALLVLALSLLPGCAALRRPPAEGSAPAAAAGELTLRGSFHIVWGDRARYFLADDAGKTRELLLDEELMRPHGGPLALDGKRVRVTAEPAVSPGDSVRVLSLQPDPTRR